MSGNKTCHMGRSCLALLILTIAYDLACCQVSSVATYEIPLIGHANGGELSLNFLIYNCTRHASITTSAGELPESVVKRLVEEANRIEVSKFGIPTTGRAGNTIILGNARRGEHCLGGSETGLGIPAAPRSVSFYGEPFSKQYRVRWRSPDKGYDSVTVMGHQSGVRISGACDTCLLPRTWGPAYPVLVTVIGYKNGIPSNAGGVFGTPSTQTELLAIDYTCGVMPNWSAWNGGEEGLLEFHKGMKSEREYVHQRDIRHMIAPHIVNVDQKPTYQSLSTKSNEAIGGVWREYLGLTAGHVYCLRTRLKAPASDISWKMSFHACPSVSGRVGLSPGEFAGLESIELNGTPIRQTQLFEVSGETNGRGEWLEKSSDQPSRGNLIGGDITLPGGSDSLVVWFKVEGQVPAEAGFDYVALEDLTGAAIEAAGPTPIPIGSPDSPFYRLPKRVKRDE